MLARKDPREADRNVVVHRGITAPGAGTEFFTADWITRTGPSTSAFSCATRQNPFGPDRRDDAQVRVYTSLWEEAKSTPSHQLFRAKPRSGSCFWRLWQGIPPGIGNERIRPTLYGAVVDVSISCSVGKVSAMARWRVTAAFTLLAALCVLSLVPAGPAAAAPCDPSGGLLGVVGLCSSGHSSSAPPAKPTPSPSPGRPAPAPAEVTPAPSSPVPQPAVLPQQTKSLPAPPTTAAPTRPLLPAPTATQPATSPQTTGPAVVDAEPHSPRTAAPVTPSPLLAGILLAVGGCLITVGGALGLRKLPR